MESCCVFAPVTSKDSNSKWKFEIVGLRVRVSICLCE